MLRTRFARLSVVIGTATLLAACGSDLFYEPHTVEKHSDAGAFTIAATMVETWDNFVDKLSPDFKLNETDALAAAIPRSAISEKQMLDVLAVALKVAPPTSVTSGTATETLSAVGTTETTGSETTTTGAGDLSKATAPTVPGTTLTQQAPTKLPAAATGVKIDPILKYTVATALFQEVKLLNNAVRAAARRHDMVPYILRLQINNVPFARHQPYDTYAMLSLFAREVCRKKEADGTKVKKCAGVRGESREFGWMDRGAVVVPLLVTDNLESLLSSRSSNVVRQIAMAASILQGGLAASLGLTRKTEELNAVLGNDLNSLMTVGRPASSSLYVRLGAMLEATARYAMVPRNYSITVLVLVPEDQKPGGKIEVGDIEGIRITGSVTYRNAETGIVLPRDPPQRRRQFVRDVLQEFSGSDIEIGDIGRRRLDHLRVSIYVNDYGWFRDILTNKRRAYIDEKGTPEKEIPIGAPADLWNALLERNVSTGYFGADVHLPKPPPRALPATQTFILIDDGKATMEGKLAGGSGLGDVMLQARLVVPLAGGGTITLMAPPVANNPAGEVKFSFPSLAVYKIKPKGTGKAPLFLPGTPLTLTPIPSSIYDRKSKLRPVSYQVAYLVRPSKLAPGATFTVLKTALSVTADQAKKGQIQLHVDFQKGLDAAQGDYVELAIDGADLTAATGANVSGAPNFGKVKIAKNGTVTLALANLVAGTKIKITATGKDKANKSKGGKVPLEIDVK